MSDLHLAPVTVVIPCYQCATTIERAVDSIAMQTMLPVEVVLVEDGSGDDTLEMLYRLKEKYGNWLNVIEQQQNSGVASARNAGWDAASQPYIAFLDADDAWHPNKIEIQYRFMATNPSIAMSGHAHRRLSSPEQQPSWSIGKWRTKTISQLSILLSNRFITPSIMLKREIPFRFSEGKRHMEDHLLWSQIVCSGLQVVRLSVELAAIYKFAYGVAGLSGQFREMHRGEVDNYKQLGNKGAINSLTMAALVAFAMMKAMRRLVVVGLLKAFTPTAKHIFDYMTLTYSITGLLVVLGIAGEHEMAADVAIVQGAILATFYVLSGDMRHLILAERVQARHVLFFRFLWVAPLACLSYILSVTVGHVEAIIASALILRRSAEWLAEVHITEIERQGGRWPGLLWQIILFLLVSAEVIFSDSHLLIWVWALSPLFFSLRFLTLARFHNHIFLGNAHVASTAIMGLANYIFRILVVGLAGKVFSGMLFPAIAIGSFAGTMFANVAGPTIVRKGILNSAFITLGLALWSVVGIVLFVISNTLFQQTLGLSMIGGVVMIYAQHERLMQLKEKHTLGSDMLIHVILVCITPIIYYALGVKWLSAIYLVNALLALVFYKGSKTLVDLNQQWRNRLLFMVVLGLIVPVFFQLQGHVYRDGGPLGMVDSGGNPYLVPLPLSIIFCYFGLAFFYDRFQQSKSAILMIASFFLLLIFSTLITGQGAGKLLLLVQFILPTAALLLGTALANVNRKLIAETFLIFLSCFVPLQLICTWIQGNLALTHYLYLFSVYQHFQYVPLIMACLYAWVWVELHETHRVWIYLFAPWMGMYVAAGNSMLALTGLIAFGCFYVIKSRSRQNILISLVLMGAIGGYFYLNSQIAPELKHSNIYHGVFVGKLFKKNGGELYSGSGNTQLPVNVTDRVEIASRYWKGITENPTSLVFGHASPPPRKEITSGHNYYLDLTYNFGLLACLPLLALIVFTINKYFKDGNRDLDTLCLLAIVVYLVLIDSNLKVTMRQPYPGMVVFFLWGILLTLLDQKQQKR